MAKAKKKGVSDGIVARLKEQKTPPPYAPEVVERKIIKYVKKRISEMQDYRRSLNIEGRWKQADEEYVPHELDFGTTRKRFETDQDTGLRSRMVPVGDASQQWRQASSAPTLLTKIQTALSIIVDNQPEAELVALLKKYQGTTALAYALWKRNWSITDAKEKLKLVVFDLFKYGWAAQRTYPRKVQYDKRVLIEKDLDNPENDKYEDKEVLWFNDVDRERLNPYRTWIDEMTKPYDQYSMNECYYELDYSYDSFMVEFGSYPNAKFVPEDSAMQRTDEGAGKDTNRQTVSRSQSITNQSKVRKDIVTVGFFESRTKDLYILYIPAHGIVLYHSPMPNDDGYLSLTHTMLILRSSNLPYGISLWDIIRQNKGLYDKMKNMTMDQLVLSIMKFGFFSGTSTVLGDGMMPIVPGQARQLTTSSGDASKAVQWMEIPGPGAESWKGISALMDMMDNESGISSVLEGQDQPGTQTLGEILHNKEAALKRLKVPVENIAWLINQDAYLSLSWMGQLYAMPTIKEFSDEAAMMAFEKEEQVVHTGVFANYGDDGEREGNLEAHYLPQLSLHLEDSEGSLKEGKESKFFQVGKDIMPNQLKWKGIFKTIPRSIIDSSQELMKASKTEMANMLIPLFQHPPEMVAKVAEQLVKINEEDPEDWLPDNFLDYLKNGAPPTPPPSDKPSVSVSYKDASPALKAVIEQDLGVQPQQSAPGQPQGAGGAGSPGGPGVPPGASPTPSPMMPAANQTMQNQTGNTPPASPQTVVPQGQVTPPSASPVGNGIGKSMGVFGKRL